MFSKDVSMTGNIEAIAKKFSKFCSMKLAQEELPEHSNFSAKYYFNKSMHE